MTAFYTVKKESDGYRVYTASGWGIGYTFQSETVAEDAAATLNSLVQLDQGGNRRTVETDLVEDR